MQRLFIFFQTFLGIKVEQELQRKQADRRGRRENYGDIKMKKVQAYGKLCSPFKALSVPVSKVDGGGGGGLFVISEFLVLPSMSI